jgi:NAD(P)-dependent dehydrogenase (short-subunit alcohol dehydrogenase family)
MGRVEGKAVIVTGAASGIGRAMATGLAAEGARVVVADRDARAGEATAAALRQAGGEACFVLTDVARPADGEALARETVDRFGRLDAVVCNAGIARRAPALDVSEAEWDDILATNLRGAFFGARAAARQMVETGGGAVVFTSSQLADFPRREMAAYIASKAALLGLTRALALEWGRHRIRVNAIQPGVIETPLNRERLGRPGEAETDRARVALDRLGQPADLVGVTVFLVSDESAYVTGASVRVDGGWLGP